MEAVSGSAFGIIGEWVTVGLFSDNMFDLLFLKSNAPACHLVTLYHRMVLPPTMCVKVAYFLCPLERYVNSLPPCAQFLWFQQYFGVRRVNDSPRSRLVPLLSSRPRPRPRPCTKISP